MNPVLTTTESAVVGGDDRAARSRLAARRRSRTAAFTLVEVMIAAIIFTMTAISVGTMFLQNNNMSMRLRYRTNATNAALNILEQVRVLNFDTLNTFYTTSAPTTVTGAYVRVLISDPNAPDHTAYAAPDSDGSPPGVGADPIPLRYQNLDLVLNVRDGVLKNATWSPVLLPLSSSTTSTRMKMRFWLTLKYNQTVSADTTVTAHGQVFEIALVYQWKAPGAATASASTTTGWESGTVRAVVQNPNPIGS